MLNFSVNNSYYSHLLFMMGFFLTIGLYIFQNTFGILYDDNENSCSYIN